VSVPSNSLAPFSAPTMLSSTYWRSRSHAEKKRKEKKNEHLQSVQCRCGDENSCSEDLACCSCKTAY
jgi:hypothetical protein